MSLIKIFANDIELDFVKETLSIKKENTALTRDFKVAHSTFPFLIIENLAAKQALGTRALASVNKIKTVEVTVFEGGKKYLGELQILSYLNGFRKCNLKYSSELLSIMNTKISTLMPTVSVVPYVGSPMPYVEKQNEDITGFIYYPTNWETYPVSFLNQGFPDVKWQFPIMRWANKYGTQLTADDEWFDYQGFINNFNPELTSFIENSYVDTNYEILSVSNKNVVSPQVYLLSPLLYALQSKGFTAEGDFYNHEFIKRILLQSSKTNLTETTLFKLIQSCVFTGSFSYFPARNLYIKSVILSAPYAGDYIVNYSFTFAGPVAKSVSPSLFELHFRNRTAFSIPEIIFSVTEITEDTYTITGTQQVNIPTAGTGYSLMYLSKDQVMPLSYSLSLNSSIDKPYYKMHPTIQLGRFIPDWTFASYLNALQNFFNLDISIDDFSKKMYLNFNENTIATGEKVIVKKSMLSTTYEQTPYNAFILKYENDEDPALWITTAGTETYSTQKSDFSETLVSKFKLVPTTYMANLSEEYDSKSGVGLMIYNHDTFPYTVSSYEGQNLNIEGSGGIYESFWNNFIKFRLNTSVIEMSGPFTETELNKIMELKRIFVDDQEYIISDSQYSETLQDNFDVKFNLLSVNF